MEIIYKRRTEEVEESLPSLLVVWKDTLGQLENEHQLLVLINKKLVEYLKEHRLQERILIQKYYEHNAFIFSQEFKDELSRIVVDSKDTKIINSYKFMVKDNFKDIMDELIAIPDRFNEYDIDAIKNYKDFLVTRTVGLKEGAIYQFYSMFMVERNVYKKYNDGCSTEIKDYLIPLIFDTSKWVNELGKYMSYSLDKTFNFDTCNRIREFMLSNYSTSVMKHTIKNLLNLEGLATRIDYSNHVVTQIMEVIFNEEFFDKVCDNRDIRKFVMEQKLSKQKGI